MQAQCLFEKIRSQKKRELEHSKYYSYCINKCNRALVLFLCAGCILISLLVIPPRNRRKFPNAWIPDLDFTMFNKQSLLDPGPVGWMTDTIINAAQILIKQQFPHIQSLSGCTFRWVNPCKSFIPIIIGLLYLLHWEEFKFPVFSAHQRI